MTQKEFEEKIQISYDVQNALKKLKEICEVNECGEGCPIYHINDNNKHNPYISCPCSDIDKIKELENNGEKYRYKQIANKNRY